jgi:hypothetical protein
MQITIFGATGMVGKPLVKSALAAGHTVIAFGRDVTSLLDEDEANDYLKAYKGYVFDEQEVYEAINGSDAVISVLGGAFDGSDKTRSLGMKNIIKQMDKAGVTRIVALGGMGILNAKEDGLIIDQPSYPTEYLPVGKEHLQAYQFLKESNLDWTFVCAPDIKDEASTGSYITRKDYPPASNQPRITAGDLAAFMLSEVSRNEFVRSRVGIANQ